MLKKIAAFFITLATDKEPVGGEELQDVCTKWSRNQLAKGPRRAELKLLMDQGIPREQIIHLAYDDVANNYDNPFKGQLFNVPITADVSEATLS